LIDYRNPLPAAVCAVINTEGKILVGKRNREPGKNKWALPGGFIESNESPESACLRELKEETGLKGTIKGLAGVYLRKTKIYESIIVIGYAVEVSNENICISDELKDAKFFHRNSIPYIPFLVHRKIIKRAFEKIFV
jgi:ADP-ribose pyrophosphatase YjhB (NUDIX family)